jgi:hypothetical protein
MPDIVPFSVHALLEGVGLVSDGHAKGGPCDLVLSEISHVRDSGSGGGGWRIEKGRCGRCETAAVTSSDDYSNIEVSGGGKDRRWAI